MIEECQKLHVCGANPNRQTIASLVSADVLRRAGIAALILGSMLTLTNQSGAVFGKDQLQALPLATAYLTPFVVATISQALGLRQALLDLYRRKPVRSSQDTLLNTAISHGIPLRTLWLALIVGTLNTMIVVFAAALDDAVAVSMPMTLVGQGFFLPMLFSLLSQTVSYRRAKGDFAPPTKHERKTQ